MEDHSSFLSDDDVRFLTGYTLASKQCEHLAALGIPFYTDRGGHPRVLKAALLKTSGPRPPTLNFDALDHILGR